MTKKEIKLILKSITKDTVRQWETTILDFEKVYKANNHVSFLAIINQLKFELNSEIASEQIDEFVNQILTHWKNKNDIQFNGFTLSWIKDSKYSLVNLVPIILEEPKTNNQTLSLIFSTDEVFNKIAKKLNLIIQNNLSKNKSIEILPKLLIHSEQDIENLSVFFGKEYLTNEY